jgi:hypothetical protein
MALILPSGPSWTYSTNNLGATPSTSTFGVNVTSGTGNSDGTAVTLLSALTHDVELIEIFTGEFSTSGDDSATLMDILYDPAGGSSWQTLISDLIVGYSTSQASLTRLDVVGFAFPLWIPAGASIGAQARSASSSSQTGGVMVFAKGGNKNPASWWAGQGVESIGINAASSQGTLITPDSSGAFSSWTDLGAPTVTTYRGGAIQFGVQGVGNATNTRAFYVQFGIGSNQIGVDFRISVGSTESGTSLKPGLMFHDIPAGAQLQARGTAHTTNTDQLGVAAYVVY